MPYLFYLYCFRSSGPKHGDFLNIVSGKVIQSFTLNDLHLEDVVYRHHGNSSSFSDMAMLLASDAFEQLSIILSITLRLKVTEE